MAHARADGARHGLVGNVPRTTLLRGGQGNGKWEGRCQRAKGARGPRPCHLAPMARRWRAHAPLARATRHQGPARAGSRARRTMRGGRGGGQSRGRWRAQGSAGGNPQRIGCGRHRRRRPLRPVPSPRRATWLRMTAWCEERTACCGTPRPTNGVVSSCQPPTSASWHSSGGKEHARGWGRPPRARPSLSRAARPTQHACAAREAVAVGRAPRGRRKGRTSACCELPAQRRMRAAPTPSSAPSDRPPRLARRPAPPRDRACAPCAGRCSGAGGVAGGCCASHHVLCII